MRDKSIADLLKKARESIQAAGELSGNKHFDFSASRSYYAMFYVAEALLLTKNLSFSSHKGVISSFGRDFIKPGTFPPELHQYLRDAFRLRQLGDYGIPGTIDREKAEQLIRQAKDFIEEAEKYFKDKKIVLDNSKRSGS